MEISKFIEILNDKNIYNFEKMHYKYRADFDDFLENYVKLYCKELPINDFSGERLIYNKTIGGVFNKVSKLLMQKKDEAYGVKNAEDEIFSSNIIENINFNRDSIRNILKGMAPKDEIETRILGQKKGLEFIADTSNKITEENIHKLYMMTVGCFLEGEDRLLDGNFYRHDAVYVVGGDKIEHSGISRKKLPQYMSSFVRFINSDDDIDDLQKGAIIHFYFAYLHPYFDGNGRMSRLMHLWFLFQKGYTAALFVPFSSLIERSKSEYYKAFSIIEDNEKIAGCIDVSPFVTYFIDNVYAGMSKEAQSFDMLALYDELLQSGSITLKEESLWTFVMSNYGTREFTTKKLEKDYGNAAYATIRTFVTKFEEMGLLSGRKLSNKTVYRLKTDN